MSQRFAMLLSLLVVMNLHGRQRLTKEELIASYVYQFSRNIQWPQRKDETIKIAISGDISKAQLAAFEQLERTGNSESEYRIAQVEDIGKLAEFQIVVLLKPEKEDAINVFGVIDGRPVLLVTEGLSDRQMVMINLIETPDKRMTFEINRGNILGQGLMPKPELVLLGGTEIDVAKLYKEGQASLLKLRKRLMRNENRVVELQGKITKQEKELRSLASEAERTKQELEARKSRVENLSAQMRTLQADVLARQEKIGEQEMALEGQEAEKQRLLKENEQSKRALKTTKDRLNDQQLTIARLKAEKQAKEREITEKEAKLREIQLVIAERKEQLNQQVARIREQEAQIRTQEGKISFLAQKAATQRNVLRLSIGVGVLFAVLLGTILLAYRSKQRDNKHLVKQREELERMQVQLRHSEQAALSATKAKTMFLASMSHEIRSPLNSVLGFAEILGEQESNPRKLSYINNIRSSGRILLNLINDVLDLSKIEAGKADLQYKAFSPESLFSEVKTIFSRQIAEKDVVFDVKVDSDVPKVIILDDVRLRQIVINLISNAAKFTDSGSIMVSVGATTSKTDEGKVDLTISVTDTGIGIAADQLDRIFNSFEQTKGHDLTRYGGTGLGLAIAKNLAEMMQGEIVVTSELGRGACFKVILHGVEQALEEAFPGNEIGGKPELEALSFSPATILIADDISQNREILTLYLKQFGFTFVHAENGHEVLEQVNKNTPDLVLLDLKMPDMDGYEVLKILKNDDQLKAVPVVVITASGLKQDEERVRQKCDGYLRKPVTKMDVVKEIMQHIPYQKTLKEATPPLQEIAGTLVPPPVDELEKLRPLVMMGDMDGVLQFADELTERGESFGPLAAQLRQLATGMKDEELETLLEGLMTQGAENVE